MVSYVEAEKKKDPGTVTMYVMLNCSLCVVQISQGCSTKF